jgi:hypothetical protein
MDPVVLEINYCEQHNLIKTNYYFYKIVLLMTVVNLPLFISLTFKNRASYI